MPRDKVFDLSCRGVDLTPYTKNNAGVREYQGSRLLRFLGIPLANVLGEWSAGSSDSSYLRDISGNGRDLAATAGPTFADSSIIGRDKNLVKAFSYNGSTQYHSLDHASWMNVFDGDFSLVFLVRSPASNPAGNTTFFSHGSGGADGVRVQMNTTGFYQIILSDSGASPTTQTASDPSGAADGLYHIIHIVRSSNTVTTYKDGAPGASNHMPYSTYGKDGSRAMYIGVNDGPTAPYWGSPIAYTRLQNTALTFSQIRKELALWQGIAAGTSGLQFAMPTFQRSTASQGERLVGSASLFQVPADWPVMGREGGITIQGATTQICTYTNDLSNAAWAKTACSASNTPVTLRNGNTGTTNTIKEDDTDDTQHQMIQSFSVTTGSSYCCYAEFKYNAAASNPRQWVVVLASDVVGLYGTWFNLATGTWGFESASNITAGRGFIPLPDGKYGIWCWFTSAATTTAAWGFGPTEADNDDRIVTEVVGGQDSVFVENQQIESGKFPTLHVPRTTATAASRSADSLTFIPWRITKDLARHVAATPRLLFNGSESLNGATVSPTTGAYSFTKNGRPQNGDNFEEGAHFRFNGSTDYLSLADGSGGSDFDPAGDFSVVCTYVPFSVAAGQYTIVSKWNTTGNQRGWELYQSANSIYLARSSNGTANVAAGVTSCLEVGKPVLITATYSTTGGLTVRVDAITAGTQAATGAVYNSTADLLIGALSGPSSYLNGKLHYLAYYDNYVVSAGEHTNMYAAFKTDGILPLTMSATTPKTKLIVEFEAKGQYSSASDVGGNRRFIEIAGNTGVSSTAKNLVGIYAGTSGKTTFHFYDSVGTTTRSIESGVGDVVWSNWHKYYFVLDLGNLANSELAVDGVSEKDATTNLTGTDKEFSTKDTLIRLGQSANGTVLGHAEIRNVKFYTE